MKFFLPDWGEAISDAREITGIMQPKTPSLFAEDVASYLYSNDWHDDENWPLRIAVVDDTGSEVGRFKVNIDFDPTFYAEEIK